MFHYSLITDPQSLSETTTSGQITITTVTLIIRHKIINDVCDLNSSSNGHRRNGYLSTKPHPEEYFNLHIKYIIKFWLKKHIQCLFKTSANFSCKLFHPYYKFSGYVCLVCFPFSFSVIQLCKTNQVCCIKNIPSSMSLVLFVLVMSLVLFILVMSLVLFVQLCPLSCLFQ